MSTEDLRAVDGGHPDDQLLQSLRAFGLTLESEVTEPMRAEADGGAGPNLGVGTGSDVGQSPRREPGGGSRYRLAVWAAAATVLVAAGFGLGVFWSGDGESINSVGGETDGPTPTTDAPDGTTGSPVEPSPAPDQPATPSVIQAADGSVLVVVDEATVGSVTGGSASRTDVIVSAIVGELLRLEPYAGENEDSLAELLATSGLEISTTLDPSIHELAAASLNDLHPTTGDVATEVGMVTIDHRTGAIVDISSSPSASDTFLASARPPGSAMKTLVLAALMEDGYQPGDIVRADGPCEFPLADGSTYTVGGRDRGEQSVAAATRSSNNCAYVRLGQIVGIDRLIEMSDRLGLSLPEYVTEETLSLPLGSVEVKVLELAGAYAALANDGLAIEPWLIESVADRDGTVVYRHTPEPRQAVSANTARQVNAVLASNVEAGTGKRAQLSSDVFSEGSLAAGKTGTTPTFTDAWFVGYTNYYTTAVWLGAADGVSRMRIPGWNSFGGGLPATIWGDFNTELHKDLPPVPFDEGSQTIDPRRLVVDGEPPR